MSVWTYRGYDADSRGKVAPRLASLASWLKQQDPAGRSLGAYAHRAVRGGRTPSVHQCGRALDWAPGTGKAGGDRLAAILTGWPDGADIQLVIWQRRQWGGKHGPGWRPYTGADPHTTHLHIETRAWA